MPLTPAPCLILLWVTLGMCATSLDAAEITPTVKAAPSATEPSNERSDANSNRTNDTEVAHRFTTNINRLEGATNVTHEATARKDLSKAIDPLAKQQDGDLLDSVVSSTPAPEEPAETEEQRHIATLGENDDEERISLISDDAMRSKHGPVAFWLAYEATPQELQRLNEAENIQLKIDAVSRELGESKRRFHRRHRADILRVSNRRDASLDQLPHYWSRKWAATASSFWQYPYWSPEDRQQRLSAQPQDVTAIYIPVNDEVFLKQGLTHLRCTHHEATRDVEIDADVHSTTSVSDYHDVNGAMLTIEFSFADAPDAVYPFVERHIHWTLPVSMAQRFETLEHHRVQSSDDLDAADCSREDRRLGNGTRVNFRPEVIDAAIERLHREEQHRSNGNRASSSNVRDVFPHPLSFFYLFASADEHHRVSRKDWERIQSRLGALVRDVCLVTTRFDAEDGLTSLPLATMPRTGHSESLEPNPNIDHEEAYHRWLSDVADDATVFDQDRHVIEL
jgi:hypothetical protein